MTEEPIVLESNQNHATITSKGICPALSASMGMGGGYVPMIVESLNEIHRRMGWGGNMEKMFTDDVLNTLRAAQPQLIVEEKMSSTSENYNRAVGRQADAPNCFGCKYRAITAEKEWLINKCQHSVSGNPYDACSKYEEEEKN